ncbi:MAG: glucose/arabinose dehydrogenase/mono/diheme cytochrome c family protein [Cryomorphaceae bacterium]|jgi:glucose/arabinose dehydrogenase/mono/diheme cytochrome c family protein
MKKILLASILGISSIYAQQGDKRDKKNTQQIEPIPASEIPAAPYLGIEDSMKAFQVADGFQLEPIAHGEMVRMPVALDFDSDGRAWVVEMRNYMLDLDGTREHEPTGHIRVLEDTTGDGKLDKITTFLDKLILPRAIAVTPDGVLYCHEDKLYFIKRDGLKPVGKPQLIDADYAKGGNAEHKANGLLRGLDNWYYNAKSNARYRRINGKWTKQQTVFRGQWGIAQDNHGKLYSNNNSNLLFGETKRPGLHYAHPNLKIKYKANQRVGDNAVHPIRITPGVNRAYQKGLLDPKTGKIKNTTAAAGMTIYRGNQFPEKYQGMGIVSSPCANLVKLIDIKRDNQNNPKGSHPLGKKELIATTDEWFRPVNIYTAPDGSVWILDIHFGLIQHKTYMTTYLRKQYSSRGLDKPADTHGRIYRLTHKSNPLAKVPQLSALNEADLIKHLGHDNGTVRDKAQLLITEKLTSDSSSLAASLTKAFLASSKPLQQLHILWSLEATGKIPAEVFNAAIKSEDIAVHTSAMELAHLTESPSELLAIRPTAKVKSQAANSYLYALGVINTQASLERADEIIKQSPKILALQEAYLTGTTKAKSKTIASDTIRDKKLASLIKKASSVHDTAAVKQSGAGLSGDYLKSFHRGKKIYAAAACAGCHGMQGEAPAPGFPTLAPSDWVTGDPERLTKVVLNGLTGPITLNGEKFQTQVAMPPNMSNPAVQKDQDLADLFNYIRNLGENQAKQVTVNEVKTYRAKAEKRNQPWTEEDLKAAR